MSPIVRRSAPLTGRAAELDVAASHLAHLRSDGSVAARLLIIEGPSGIGKSRLVDEALGELGEDARRLAIRCLESSEGHYQAVTTGLAQLGRSRPLVDPDGSVFEDRIMAELQRAIDSGLALVTIDDLQWADQGTLQVLLRLLDGLSPDRRNPLVIATMRTESAITPAEIGPIVRHATAARMQLSGLSESEGADLLVALGAPLRFAASFPELVALVDGIPLLLEEVAAQLIALGDRNNVGSNAEAVLRELALPPSVEADAARRVEVGEPELRRLLGVLALVRESQAGSVEQLLQNIFGDRARELIDDAEDEGLIAVGASEITLSHPSLRHAVLRSLRASERRRLHEQIASTLLGSMGEADPASIVGHLIGGRVAVDEATLAVARRARRSAIDRHDWRTAADACEYVLEHVDGPELGEVQLGLGISYFMMGDGERARASLGQARSTMRELGDLAGEVWATLGQSRAIGTFQALGDTSGVELAELLDRLPAGSHWLRAEVLADMAYERWIGRDWARSRSNAILSLDEARSADNRNAEVRALTCLGLVEYTECRAEVAIDYLREALDLSVSDPLLFVGPAVRLPYALLTVGRVAEARAAAIDALDRLSVMRFTSQMAFAGAIAVAGAVLQDDVQAARRAWQSLRHWADQTGEIVATGTAGMSLASALGARGATERALSLLDQALTPMLGPTALQQPYGAELATLILAEDPARPMLDLPDQWPVAPRTDLLNLGRVCTAVEIARVANRPPPGTAQDVLEEAVQRGCRVSMAPPVLLPRVLARCYEADGQRDLALRHFDEALQLARSQDLPIELVRTQLDRLELGLVGAEDRAAVLGEVVELLVERGLLGFLDRLEIVDGEAAARARASLRNESNPIVPGSAIVLFCDIVNSTGLTREMGEVAYRHAARTVERIVRSSVAAHGGRTVEGVKLGDGALAEFADVDSAVQTGLAIQRQLVGEALAVRIGVNHGPVVREGSELFGTAINVAARTCDAANPGSVMVTADAVRHLSSDWQSGMADEGEFVMKGIERPVRLFLAEAQGSPVN